MERGRKLSRMRGVLSGLPVRDSGGSLLRRTDQEACDLETVVTTCFVPLPLVPLCLSVSPFLE